MNEPSVVTLRPSGAAARKGDLEQWVRCRLMAGGSEIERLIQLLAKLPGLGPRSARRAALVLLKKRDLLL